MAQHNCYRAGRSSWQSFSWSLQHSDWCGPFLPSFSQDICWCELQKIKETTEAFICMFKLAPSRAAIVNIYQRIASMHGLYSGCGSARRTVTEVTLCPGVRIMWLYKWGVVSGVFSMILQWRQEDTCIIHRYGTNVDMVTLLHHMSEKGF